MTAVLKIQSGNTTNTDIVDFITSGTTYVLLENGVSIPIPSVKRAMSASSGFRGERILSKHYSNREIEINFDIRANSHDQLLESVRKIQRLIDRAIENTRTGHGEKIYLEYKLNNATSSVYFDILDGSLAIGDTADVTVHRDNKLRGNKLTLICEPFARGATAPVKLRNLLVNPGFDWNPGESALDSSGRYFITIDDNTKYLSHATASNFKPTGTAPNFLTCGWWIKRGATGGAGDDVIAICGDTTPAWKLWIDATHALRFSWWDTGSTEHNITGSGALVLGSGPHLVSVCMYSTNGTDIVAILVVNGKVVGSDRVASPLAMRTPSGAYKVGQQNSTNWFEGNIYSGFVLVNMAVLPFQLTDIFLYGLDHFTGNGPFGEAYWALDSAYLKGLWMIDPADDVLDQSGNGNTLIVNGSPARTWTERKPKGWTLGAAFQASISSGLVSVGSKHGAYSIYFWEATGTATMTVEQTVNVPVGTTELTLVVWLKRVLFAGWASKIEIEWEGSTDTIELTGAAAWHQYYKTKESGIGTSTTVKFKYTIAASTSIQIDSIMILPGKPFGSALTWTEKTAPYLPYIGSSRMRNTFDLTGTDIRVPVLEVAEIPGDIDASCRVILENSGAGVNLGPIRIGFTGAISQPWASRFEWRLNSFVPLWDNDTDIVAIGSDPVVRSRAETILKDRIAIPLGRLFPVPHIQSGSYKAFICVQSELDMISLLRLQSQMAKIPLTFDPIKDINAASSTLHLVDGGILTWPPDIGVSLARTGFFTSVPRNAKSAQYTPKLLVSNIADVEIAAPNISYEWLILIPVDGGFAIAQPANANPESALLPNERLVIDTIDEESTHVGYLSKRTTYNITKYNELLSTESSDLPIFSSGFYLPTGVTGESMFVAHVSTPGSSDEPFGSFIPTTTFDMWLEYMPRYLYV